MLEVRIQLTLVQGEFHKAAQVWALAHSASPPGSWAQSVCGCEKSLSCTFTRCQLPSIHVTADAEYTLRKRYLNVQVQDVREMCKISI